MDKKDLPMVIIKSLCHQVKIYPFQLNTVLRMSEMYKIPDLELDRFDKPTFEAYVEGIWLSGQEGAGDWTKGHKILESLGFERRERREGHRCFISYVWPAEQPADEVG